MRNWEEGEDKLTKLLTTQSINNVQLDINTNPSISWGQPNNSSWFGIPPEDDKSLREKRKFPGNPKFSVTKVSINIEDWLKLQLSCSPASSMFEFKQSAYSETVEWVKNNIQNNNQHNIPEPVSIIHYDGYHIQDQEGRSRAIGAREAGENRIPVWLGVRHYK